MSASSEPAAPEKVKLTKAQLHLIRTSPIHRRIRRTVYSILGISALGFLVSIVVVVIGCVIAGPLLRQHRWLIVHYVFASLFATLWVIYTGIYYRDVKYGAWSDQLKIDGGWISSVVVLASCFFFYLFHKLQALATPEFFSENCVFTCDTDLDFVRRSPLIVGIGNIFLLAIQLYLLVLLYKNPIVNPPLDEHGMPKAINPLDGTALPIGPDGQPVLPPALRPAKKATRKATGHNKRRKGTDASSHGESDWTDSATLSASDTELEDKNLLQREVGNGSRRGQRDRQRSTDRDYDSV